MGKVDAVTITLFKQFAGKVHGQIIHGPYRQSMWGMRAHGTTLGGALQERRQEV